LKLTDLAIEIGAVKPAGRLDVDVLGVTHDSRECLKGSLFVAVRGDRTDGNRFVGQAVERGAIAVVSEAEAGSSPAAPAWIQVADARAALAQAAAAFYGHPSRRLKLVGVTGTNGKTTTAHLIDSVIRAAEGKSAMIGTINYRVCDRVENAKHTTPEAPLTQRLLAEAIDCGCRSAVMEVSSHSIALRRADALRFEAAVFTNLTQDHLDYHNTMEDYFAEKKKLFDGGIGVEPRTAVINADDPYGQELIRACRSNVITYGLGEGAQIRTDHYSLDMKGLRFLVGTPAGEIPVESPLVGRPHVYNILASAGAGLALGFEPDQIARGIRECGNVAGRFESVISNGADPGFMVVVDYAHTDDALKNALRTARDVISGGGRIIVVFGCGGDRDRTKRAPMGEAAGQLGDLAIVTSDNPRSEDPEAIISEIEVGLERTGRPYLKIPNRREAIFRAVFEAREGDIVLIAGKGHESYQIIGGQTVHFDDREVAREALMSINEA
jgi:UDP-N-acetylmuramoyl-L-alanyl-D-glutamate--2,6-diaminopimelate ligase